MTFHVNLTTRLKLGALSVKARCLSVCVRAEQPAGLLYVPHPANMRMITLDSEVYFRPESIPDLARTCNRDLHLDPGREGAIRLSQSMKRLKSTS